ncbi:D-glucuronyl C5-epimerase family protein [Alteromonas sp. A081]|uniref:D-glucuronyl C5-epimerase family protein n=1 Tax=Alteromonas sp. A081 TaxID=3410269 RepID=UPI003B9872F1
MRYSIDEIGLIEEGKQSLVEGEIHGSKMEAMVRFRANTRNIVVFLPSAQKQSEPPKIPVFHRASWGTELSYTTIITLSDPALNDVGGHACWFLSAEYDKDYIESLSEFLKVITSKLSLVGLGIYLYGSSMGGFGALMMASHLPNSHAIAEVPQLDLRTYPHQSAKLWLKSNILGVGVDEFYINQPHKVSVLSRYLKQRKIPSFTLITNTADEEFSQHVEFIRDLSSATSLVESVGEYSLKVWPEAIGHQPLDRNSSTSLISHLIEENARECKKVNSSTIIEKFDKEVVANIFERIPAFNSKCDYRFLDYQPDGAFAHTAYYGIKGADPESKNKVTLVNGGLKAWSQWHLEGRSAQHLVEVAREVGDLLLDAMTDEDIIPLNRYDSGHFQYEDGWISGIQLKTVALWSRLWTIEEDAEKKNIYKKCIYRLLNRYLKPIKEGGILANLGDVSTELSDNWLPQEYPIPNSIKQRHVLNGAQFAVIALYDTAHIVKDKGLLVKVNAYNESLLHVGVLSTVECGGKIVTSYGLEYYTNLDSKQRLGKAAYHLTHINLAAVLYGITKHPKWLELANTWLFGTYGYNVSAISNIKKLPVEEFKEHNFSVSVDTKGESFYVSTIAPQKFERQVEYASYFYTGEIVAKKFWYQTSPQFVVQVSEPITKIRFFARHVDTRETIFKDVNI